jgi:hypothetical protein
MPGRGTPKITLRVPETLWWRFGQMAGAAGVDRATLLRAFIAWYTREPGAKLPPRIDRSIMDSKSGTDQARFA